MLSPDTAKAKVELLKLEPDIRIPIGIPHLKNAKFESCALMQRQDNNESKVVFYLSPEEWTLAEVNII